MDRIASCRIRALGLLAAAGASFLSIAAAQAAEITVWCWDPNFNVAIMKEAGKRYTAANPDVTFNIVDFAKEDVEAKLQTGLASGNPDALPDIVLVEDYRAQKYLQSFPGSFAVLSDKIDFSGFAPYKVELMTLDSKVYGMPFDSGVTGLFYRRDYLEQAGFKPEDMQNITWDRYIEIGKAVMEKTGKKFLSLDMNDAGLLRIMMQSAGQWYFDKDGNTNIADNAALKAALETHAKIVKADIQKPAVGWANYVQGFTSGDAATTITGVWIVGTIKAQADQAGKWGVAPIPSLGIAGATNASNLGGSSWYVLEASPEKDQAIDFLDAIYAKDKDFYQTILRDRGAVGSLLAAREGEVYGEADPFFGGQKLWQDFSTWLGKIPPVPYGIFTQEADTAVVEQLPAIDGGASVNEALKAVDGQVATQIQ